MAIGIAGGSNPTFDQLKLKSQAQKVNLNIKIQN